MTSQSPRIYLYKITFEEVPNYYYGIHKEKVFGEEYWGSPKTNKWCWELYTPKKQILQYFDFTDEGWLEALKVEERVIRPFYNTDKWCLNASCGGKFSLEVSRTASKKAKELCVGIYGRTREQIEEDSRKGGLKGGKNGGSKSGKKNYELGIGIHAQTPEERKIVASKGGKIGGKRGGKIVGKMVQEKHRKNGTGFFGLTKEQRKEYTTKAANTKFICLETGYITNAGALTNYQRKRGIDTSKRKKVEEGHLKNWHRSILTDPCDAL